MILKARKLEDGVALMLTPEIAKALGEEAEAIHLRDGIYLVAAKGGIDSATGRAGREEAAAAAPAKYTPVSSGKNVLQISKPAAMPSLSADEMAVARRLSAIKFQSRQVPQVEKVLNAAEKKALETLLQKKLVQIMKSEKYPKGVFNISDAMYAAAKPGQAVTAPVPTTAINSVDHLKRLGYMILDNENEAKSVMPALHDQITTEDVKGVRGFDKKYYVLLRPFFMQHEGKLRALLGKGGMTCEQIAPELHLTSEAVRTLLLVLADSGEVIEKKKGMWEMA